MQDGYIKVINYNLYLAHNIPGFYCIDIIKEDQEENDEYEEEAD